MDPKELESAGEAIRAGRVEEARRILATHLQRNPRSSHGWYLMSFTLTDPAQQIECLERAVRLSPAHAPAAKRLGELRSQKPPQVATPVSRPAGPAVAARPPAPPTATGAMVSPPRSAEREPAPVRREQGPPAKESAEAPASSARPRRRLLPALLVLLGVLLIGVPAAFAAVSFFRGQSNRAALDATSRAQFTELPTDASGSFVLPPSWTPTTTATITLTPTVTATRTPTASPTPVPPNPTVGAEMDVIQTQVSDIRGLEIQADVSRFVISKSAVRPILESVFLSGGGSEEQVNDEALSLSALGLIKPTYDLYTSALNGLTDAIGGFYIPTQKVIFVIGSRFAGVERFIYSHEYGHALVDQHYDLGRLGVYPTCEGDEQRCQAITALVEGDATLLMNQWFQQYATPQDYQDILNYRPPKFTLPEQFPPPFIVQNGDFPYVQGLDFVDYLYRRGSWTRVNGAYGDLPESTEQILHPEKYVAGESPIVVEAQPLETTLGSSWRRVASSSLGEWMTYLLLGYGADVDSQIDDRTAQVAAAGWGGDRYVVYNDAAADSTVLAAHWIWDATRDAGEFASAMSDYQEKRFLGGQVDRNDGDCWEVNHQASCLFRNGRETLWLLAPDQATLDLVLSLYPLFH